MAALRGHVFRARFFSGRSSVGNRIVAVASSTKHGRTARGKRGQFAAAAAGRLARSRTDATICQRGRVFDDRLLACSGLASRGRVHRVSPQLARRLALGRRYLDSLQPALEASAFARIWWPPGGYLNYWPISYTAFWLEIHLFTYDPLPFRLVNLGLHAIAAILLWRVLVRLRLPGALSGGGDL